MKLEKFSWDWFGEARKVTITKDQTTIVDGKGEVLEYDIDGQEYRMEKGDFWLVKVKAATSKLRNEAKLDVYAEAL